MTTLHMQALRTAQVLSPALRIRAQQVLHSSLQRMKLKRLLQAARLHAFTVQIPDSHRECTAACSAQAPWSAHCCQSR